MFQYSFSLCLVAFFSAILRLSDGRTDDGDGHCWNRRLRCSTLVFAQESAAGVGSFQPLNGQMRDIKQFALASFSESFAGYSSYLVRFGFTSSCSPLLLFFCAKVFYYYMYFLFLVDLWVGHFICTYSWEEESEAGGGTCKVLVCLLEYPFWGSVPAWVRSGFMLSRWVFLFAFWVCLLTRQKSVRLSHCTSGCPTSPCRLSVRPFVCPVYVIAHISF